MDLDFLRPLYDGTGGYVSVYLDTSRDHENAAHEIEVRWADARERLASAGADDATLDALGAAFADPEPATPGRAAIGRGGRVLLTEGLPAVPRREIARVDALPHVMPLLAQRAPRVPHLRVTARHDGGDVVAVSAAGTTAEEEVIGTGWPVHKAKVGGSSQLRYERSTEEAWETNAKELAGRVTAEARRIGAELILVAGDPVARSLLAQQLGTGLAARVTIIDHEIPADSAAAAQAANQAVASYVAERSRERFAHWRNQQAHAHGVAGLAATEGALRDGAVADLLLVDHPESTLTSFIGPAPEDLAQTTAELADRGVDDPVTERADAALARAAAMTGAHLYFVPDPDPAPEDGVCAVLRVPDSAVG
jgi:hypothetical protein